MAKAKPKVKQIVFFRAYLKEKKAIKGSGDTATMRVVMKVYGLVPSAKKGKWEAVPKAMVQVEVKGKTVDWVKEIEIGRLCDVEGSFESYEVTDASGDVHHVPYVVARGGGFDPLIGSEPGTPASQSSGRTRRKPSDAKPGGKGAANAKPAAKQEEDTGAGGSPADAGKVEAEQAAAGSDEGAATPEAPSEVAQEQPPTEESEPSPAPETADAPKEKGGVDPLDDMPF